MEETDDDTDRYEPPPLFAAKQGNRQTFPSPTEFEIKEKMNSRGRSHS